MERITIIIERLDLATGNQCGAEQRLDLAELRQSNSLGEALERVVADIREQLDAKVEVRRKSALPLQ